MLSQITSAGLHGIDAYPVEVQVDIALGSLPSWNTVGLPESSVKESRERVIAAIKNCGYSFPRQRVTINLAPANIKKEGTAFDLPIALGLLISAELLTQNNVNQWVIVGELSLDGSIKPVRGALAMALMARDKKFKGMILPQHNFHEVSILKGLDIQGAKNLVEVIEFLRGERTSITSPSSTPPTKKSKQTSIDYNDIRGQEHAKRAMMIAAAGGHNLIMTGPPGAGKSMLAQCLPTILPPLSFEESLTTTKIYSIIPQTRTSPITSSTLIEIRPFRSPHHTISDVGMVGGGSIPRPGEISLAHNGVLFLDELTEFRKNTLEVLRQPMEDRQVTIVRRHSTLTFPASFILIAAMNPCPCGRRHSPKEECYCTPGDLKRHFQKISSPLLNRIDIQVPVPAVSYERLHAPPSGETSDMIRAHVIQTRKKQRQRLKGTSCFCNAQMSPRLTRNFCPLTQAGEKLLAKAIDSLGFSARAFDRILRVSRTIADLEGSETIHEEFVAEAIHYRQLDRAKL